MSDQKRPKLELPTNVPVHVEIKYPPYNGEGKDYGYGLTYKYTVIHGGEEKTWFVNENQYAEVKDFGKGDKIILIMQEEKNQQTGKTYKRLQIRPEFFDEKGNPSQAAEPKKPPLDSPDGIEAYRKKVKNALYMAYTDVDTVIEGLGDPTLFTPEIRQALATTILIDYLKKT